LERQPVDVTLVDVSAKFKVSMGLTVRESGQIPVIDKVDSKSSAFRSGLKSGDVIKRFNGANRSAAQIQKIISEAQFGDMFTVAVLRNGEEKVFRFYAE